MNIDFGKTASDYGRHRAGFPDALFDRLAGFGVGLAGQRALDVGTGTGTLARGFARRGCQVTGLDPSAALMVEAQRLDNEAGVTVRYMVGTAEQTELSDASFEGVSAGQCWHWFDRAAAARELRRVLIPSGWLVIAHFDWLPLSGNVVEATEALIKAHNSDWQMGGGTGIYPQWPRDVSEAGFTKVETFSFDVMVPYTHEAWRGRIRASAGIAASLSPEKVAAFDEAHRRMLDEQFADVPLGVPHRVFAVVCWKA